MILNRQGHRKCEFMTWDPKIGLKACLRDAEGVTTDKRYPDINFDCCEEHKRDTWKPFGQNLKSTSNLK